MSTFYVLIVAAGNSSRLGADRCPKQYLHINHRAVLAHTIVNMNSGYGYPTRVVIKKGHEELYKNSMLSLPKGASYSLMAPVYGGTRRQDSVRIGLESIEDEDPEFVVIHDACRPFASLPYIDAVLQRLADHKGVVPAVVPIDTISSINNGTLEGTLDRESLRVIQTPQIFRYKDILSCHRKVYDEDPERYFTDESSVLIACGESVAVIEGDYNNFKITTAQDVVRAAEYMSTYTPAVL
ncbi:2-C-methyl-D-erythritol 4-phosphate cytidylyltransferase [Candidatus Anaplasma sp. TIGMIC]|uniref:2-C-methyl-D-erythritol 4-phosphate cytidylyltransferase n=1 Tax=Candidatus Anaplasma sp. TIGMIC TaxID=3020713 RepID=UPI00232AB55D|nr:2-C-methyl-D-erythritol 4-phosphate cytidylyltransferase [Candidatus Anaplasma sp. TIGMIC]MDB1135296.1 2-C-methyl-D-erythritol 4-phosphate cytidylyltransferase [Candidatus Anaplasma sp. TIGMIC]